jgi:hypothetical protein
MTKINAIGRGFPRETRMGLECISIVWCDSNPSPPHLISVFAPSLNILYTCSYFKVKKLQLFSRAYPFLLGLLLAVGSFLTMEK